MSTPCRCRVWWPRRELLRRDEAYPVAAATSRFPQAKPPHLVTKADVEVDVEVAVEVLTVLPNEYRLGLWSSTITITKHP